MIKLEYIVKKGNFWEEPNRSTINRLDLNDFIFRHLELFKEKRILDLGCKDTYLRSIKEKTNYSSYFGVDIDPNSNCDLRIDFNSKEFEEFLEKEDNYGLVFALQILPENLCMIAKCLQNKAYFVHQTGLFMYEKEDAGKRIKEYFNIIKKQEYKINILDKEKKTIRRVK